MDCTEDEIRFVSSIASRFCGRGLEFQELVQEGYVGLLSAKKTFDVEKNASFFAYAFAFVQGEMRRAIRENNVIRLPKSTYAQMKRVRAEVELLRAESGQDTTVSDAANKLGIDVEFVINAMNAADDPIQIDEAVLHKRESVYEKKLEDQITDKVFIAELMQCLNEVERRVVKLRYFFDYTQKKTALIMNVSQTIISKIEKKALLKMKTSACSLPDEK